ncbi:MAG: glycosyltransferase family 2 protein [Flavobacteriales bacterium]|nr:glycosyltransferase family 2 protein [Flavobacteriales bacterium]
MNTHKVSIVVLNWSKYEMTIACVRSLQKLDYPNYEIIVVDNDSPNDSYQRLKDTFPNTEIVRSKENLGYAGGNKLGVDKALERGTDLIWILNNDTTVRPDSLTELVRSFEKYGEAIYSNTTLMSENPDIIHYAGTYDYNEEPEANNTYDKLKGTLLKEVFDKLSDRPARIYGHSLLIPVSVIKKYGFMDTDYFMFCEETDYFEHLRRAGVTTRYVRNAILTHKSSGSFKEKGKLKKDMRRILLYYNKRNRYHYAKRWNGMTTNEILKSRGGWLQVFKFFIRYSLTTSKTEDQVDDYYWNLAALHAAIGKRGRVFNPNDLLK